MAGPTKVEKQSTAEVSKGSPIAEKAAVLFLSMLDGIEEVGIEMYFSELVDLAERLLPHAKNLHFPIQRDAFLQAGPGTEVITHRGGGDGPVLGWIFDGKISVNYPQNIGVKKLIDVNVEKTDRYGGSGVMLYMKCTLEEDSLSFSVTNGVFGSGAVDVILEKNGKKHSVNLTRGPSLLKETPLTSSV